MKRINQWFGLCLGLGLLCACALTAFAQENEIAVLVGGIKTGDKGLQTTQVIKTAFNGATAYEAAYAHRLIDGTLASLHGELVIAGAPSTGIKSTALLLPKNYSSLFFTPGLKLKLFPGGLSPFVAAGVGLGRYKASDTALNGLSTTGDKTDTSWVFNYGGGVDVRLIGPVGVRGEIRDFITGTPKFNMPFFEKRQHNVFAAAGIVLNF